mgnify:CR=1 FL=1
MSYAGRVILNAAVGQCVKVSDTLALVPNQNG